MTGHPTRHPLAVVLAGAAAGRFPPADGLVDVWPPDVDGTVAVVALSGHGYVLADVDPTEVAARQTDEAGGGFGGVLAPRLLSWLAGTGGRVGSTDVVLAAPGGGFRRDVAAGEEASLVSDDSPLQDHPRVRRARRYRRDVEVLGDNHGIVIGGRGLVGRWELSVELFDPSLDSDGAGRRLLAAGLAAAPAGEATWAQVAAGNARSLRTFLAAGFLAVGAEVLIHPSD